MEKKSLVNAAYDVLTKRYAEEGNKPMKFNDLALAVGQEVGIESEEELLAIVSRFYTDLTLDGRFVIKENNTWVLREHELYENVHIDMNQVYMAELDGEGEDEEKKEEDIDENSDEDEILEQGEDDEKFTKNDDDHEAELGEEDEEGSFSSEDYDENN